MKAAARNTMMLLCAFGLIFHTGLASGAGRSLTQLSGTTNPLVEQASSIVGQVAATADNPASNQWNTYAYRAAGPTAPQTASFANKLEAVIASGLPSAISETYGQPGNPLSADQVLQFLQSLVTGSTRSRSSLAPAAALPAVTLNAAADQVAAILVANSLYSGQYTSTISRRDPNYASGQLQDVYTEVAEDVAEGLDRSTDNSPTSSVSTGKLVQSLVRAGLAQPSFAGASAAESTATEQVLETKALQFGLQQRVPTSTPATPAPTTPTAPPTPPTIVATPIAPPTPPTGSGR